MAARTGERDMSTHFTVIAAINLVLAVPAILVGIFVFLGGLVGGGIVGQFSDVPAIGPVLAGAGLVIGLVTILLGVPAIVSAIGLLQDRDWAKPWTMIAAVLHFIYIPIGTAFGIYALWAMTRPETDAQLGSPSEPGPAASGPQRP
jgi:hypothetical protein